VSVAVRPEKLRLNTEIAEGNNLKGRVEDVIYIGTDTHYGVRFAGGQKVRVREQNIMHRQRRSSVIGDEVLCLSAYVISSSSHGIRRTSC
jgi:ABC-type Fe3+/spermidine/putrescine transport system ATPase subunit